MTGWGTQDESYILVGVVGFVLAAFFHLMFGMLVGLSPRWEWMAEDARQKWWLYTAVVGAVAAWAVSREFGASGFAAFVGALTYFVVRTLSRRRRT